MGVAKLGLVTLALFTTLSYPQTHHTRFPGEVSRVSSPDGRYIVRNVDNPQEPYHTILLENKSTGVRRKVYDYGRSVSIVWAPNSRRFALNDYAGSNLTNTYIFDVDHSIPTIDVQEEIIKRVDTFRQHKWDHDYFGVSKWLGNGRVSVLFWGHGGSPSREFCECYVYALGGSVQKCAKSPSGAQTEQRCGELAP